MGKHVYVDKLKELKLVGEATKKRKTEFEGRKAAIESLGHSLQMASKVAKLIEEKKNWMDQSCSSLDRTDKVTNPPILVCQFYQEQTAFEKISRPILNKPKPKIEPPPKEDKKE